MSDYSLPPPTYNSLGPKQRARLIQSSRKLEALLGTTPQFIELASTPIRSSSLRRHGSPCSSVSSFGGSSESLAPIPPPKPKSGLSIKLISGGTFAPTKIPKTPKTAKHAAPSPLVIQYQTLGAGYDPRASIISVIPTDDSAGPTPRSPLSPSNSHPLDFRRRRMAKLARTLGENVPPELVFRDLVPESSPNDRKQLRASRGRSWSVGSQAHSITPILSRKPSIMKHSFETENRTRDSLAFQSVTERSISRADSYTSETGRSSSQFSRSSTPFSQHSIDSGNTRRKQREWSGEWNVDDMDDVIKNLRDLRAK